MHQQGLSESNPLGKETPVNIIAPLRALTRKHFRTIDGLTPAERALEALSYYKSRSPLVTRRTMRKRERNAFELGMDCGAYSGQGSSHLKRVSA